MTNTENENEFRKDNISTPEHQNPVYNENAHHISLPIDNENDNTVIKADELIDIIKRIEQQITHHQHLSKSKKKYFLKEIRYAIEQYDTVEIPPYLQEQYRSLLKGGDTLMKEIRRSNQFTQLGGKITYYLRFIVASLYDFKNDLKGMNLYIRFMLVAATGFMLLTPQFYGFVLPLIFIIPLFIGVKSIKKRSRTGLYMTMAVLPVAFMSGLTYCSWTVRTVVPDYAGAIADICTEYNVVETLANIWVIGFGILAPATIICAILATYYGVKYYRMFL